MPLGEFSKRPSSRLAREEDDPLTLFYYRIHRLHQEFSPEPPSQPAESTARDNLHQESSPEPPSQPAESTARDNMSTSDHHRQSSADHSTRRTSPASSRTAGQETSGGDDEALNAVYRAFVENPDFLNRLADVLRANPGGIRGPPGPAGTPSAAGHEQNHHWRADEVGFFFPDLHSSYGASEIVTIGKDSFYRNASVFLDRLDDIVRLRGAEVVRNNIPTCLRGAALQ